MKDSQLLIEYIILEPKYRLNWIENEIVWYELNYEKLSFA
jgi:hypothetical protein